MGQFDFFNWKFHEKDYDEQKKEKHECIDELKNEIDLIVMDFKESLNKAKELLKNSKAA